MTSALWAPQGGPVWELLGALPRRKAPGTEDQGTKAGLALAPTGTYVFMRTLLAIQACTHIHLSAEPGVPLQPDRRGGCLAQSCLHEFAAVCSHLRTPAHV